MKINIKSIDESNRVEELNLSTTIIRIPNHDKSRLFASATGFFYRNDNDVYLVTNYHVLSGRHPVTHSCLSKTGYCDYEEIAVHLMTYVIGEWKGVTIPITNGFGKRLYQYIHGMDVAVIKVTDIFLGDIRPAVCVNDNNSENMFMRVGIRVTLLGNPWGYSKHTILPIWKTGYIASEPNIVDDDSFIIDAKTFGGMSGSPVFLWRTNESFQTINKTYLNSNHVEFIGIYSDRPHINNMEINKFTEMGLGTVWKRKCIEQLLSGNGISK